MRWLGYGMDSGEAAPAPTAEEPPAPEPVTEVAQVDIPQMREAF